MTKKFISLIVGMLLFSTLCYADENIDKIDENTPAVLNEELRQLRQDKATIVYVDEKIAANAPIYLGAWDGASYSNNTAYLAATDGFVVGVANLNNSDLQGYTDSSNPPTTQRAGSYDPGAGTTITITMPVKKNDYWKTVQANTALYWIPLGD